MMCDPAAVDGMMEEMDDIEICATDWARFYDRAMGVSWNGRTVQSQGEMIELFCASPCGPVFDGMLKDFRDACEAGKGRMMEALQEGVQAGEEEGEEGEAGRWVHVPEFNRVLYRMLGEAPGREGGREGRREKGRREGGRRVRACVRTPRCVARPSPLLF